MHPKLTLLSVVHFSGVVLSWSSFYLLVISSHSILFARLLSSWWYVFGASQLLPPHGNFILEIQQIATKNCGYLAFIISSFSQVAFSTPWLFHRTLTMGITFLLSTYYFLYRMHRGPPPHKPSSLVSPGVGLGGYGRNLPDIFLASRHEKHCGS